MIKNKKLLMIPLLSFLCLNNVYADCTKEEIDAFKEIEDEYKVTYEFDKESKTYTLNFYNPEPEKYGYAMVNTTEQNIMYDKKNENNYSWSNISAGKIEIEIQSINPSCEKTFKTINLTLMEYNKYSEDALCQGIEEFVLCQETYGKDIDYETFKSRVETYKRTKENDVVDNKTNNIDKEISIVDKMINYLQINYLKVIIIALFSILLIVTIIISLKSLKKSRRLE